MHPSENSVWYVTGSSTGFGLELVALLLQSGCQVTGTTRNIDKLKSQLTEKFQISIDVIERNLLAVNVDLINEESIKSSVKSHIDKFKKLDVVVNNAGYSQVGAVEEVTDKEAREQFDINVFGLLNVLRATLPFLKESAKGKSLGSRIYNISSVGGSIGYEAFGIYSGTKFAVNGITESLAKELKPLNVYATHVDPGYFRTDFLTSAAFAKPSTIIPGYDSVRTIIDTHSTSINHNQPGDPKKGMQVLINVASQPNPPVQLIIGSDAVGLIENHLTELLKDIKNNKPISSSTNF